MQVGKNADADDDRPPICPACGVTMGIAIDEDGSTRYVCLECGFSDDSSKGSELRASDFPPRRQDGLERTITLELHTTAPVGHGRELRLDGRGQPIAR